MLFVAKPNKVNIDNNATFAMWTKAIIIPSLFASSSHSVTLHVHLHTVKTHKFQLDIAWNNFMDLFMP